MTVLASSIDWTMILETLIITIPAILAAIFAGLIHRAVQTPSGKPLGQVAEYAHDTAIANNLLLSKQNGLTQTAITGELKLAGQEPPQVPADHTKA